MKTKSQIMAITTVMLLLTVSFAVVVNSTSDSDATDTFDLSYDDPEVQTLANEYMSMNEPTAVSQFLSERGYPQTYFLPLLICIVVAAIAFTIADYLDNGDKGDGKYPTADEGTIKADLRQARAELIGSNWDNISNLFYKLGLNEAQLISFTEVYFALQAETAAAALWTDEGIIVPDRMLTESTWIYNMSVYKYNVQSAINQFALSMSNQRNIFNEKGDTYNSMRMGWMFDDLPFGLDHSSGDIGLAIVDTVTPTNASDRVYIDVVMYDDILSNSNYLYLFGGAATITNAITGRTYALSEGVNDMVALDMQSGWYVLQTGVTYAGNFLPSSSIRGLTPTGAMLLYSNSDLALATGSQGAYSVTYGGITQVVSDISMKVTWPDDVGIVTTLDDPIDIWRILDAYSSIVESINHSAVTVTDAALTAWAVYDHLGKSSALIKPSSILAGMQVNTDLTVDQATAIYLMVMKQLAIYGENVRPDNIKITRESLDLVVHGDIYFQGSLIAKNAVYTPLAYLKDTDITVGQGQWDTHGFAIIWALDVNSLADWNGITSNYAIIEMSPGYHFKTYNIVYAGEEVSTLTLTIERMEYLGLVDFGVSDFAPVYTFYESKETEYLMIIIILVMIIVCLLATYLPPQIGMIVVLIAIVGGALALLIVSGILEKWIHDLVDWITPW